MDQRLARFLLPKLDRRFGLRLAATALVVFLACRFVLRPTVVSGESMAPTYSAHGFNFCRLLAFRNREPRRGEVVVLRYGGERWMLLKRILAFPGETVEFRNGVLHVDGAPLDEPYVQYPSDWNSPPKTVPEGWIFVMGDNRSMPMETHVGGCIARSRLIGKPLW